MGSRIQRNVATPLVESFYVTSPHRKSFTPAGLFGYNLIERTNSILSTSISFDYYS